MDETGVLKGVAYGDKALKISQLEAPFNIKIKNGYLKMEGLVPVIQLRYFTEVEVSQNMETELPKNLDLNITYPRSLIGNVSEGLYEIRGTITKVADFLYINRYCDRCGSKVKMEYGKYFCPNCGEIQNIRYLTTTFIYVDDGTGVVKASFFQKNAENLVGKKLSEILEEIEMKGLSPEHYPLDEVREKIIGKEVILSGKISQNPEFTTYTMRCERIRFADPLEEAYLLLKDLKKKVEGEHN